MLRRLLGGAAPDAETRKLCLTTRLLGLRARRPEPFAGAYEPLDAGPATCAFMRGGDVLVAVAVRSGPVEGTVEAPRGQWRDVLRGEERSFGVADAGATIVGEHGIAVFERLSRRASPVQSSSRSRSSRSRSGPNWASM